MIKLNELANLTWIDHHKSAIDNYNDYLADGGEEFNGLLQIGKAGCELAWEYWYDPKDIPLFVKLLGRYDVWDKEDKRRWEEFILPFQYGMNALARWKQMPGIDGCIWERLFCEHELNKTPKQLINEIMITGGTIKEYQEGRDAKAAKSGFFNVEINGLTLCACNSAIGFNSRLLVRL